MTTGPIAFRYPRGEGVGVEMPARGRAAGDRQGPGDARGDAGGDPVLRHAAGRER